MARINRYRHESVYVYDMTAPNPTRQFESWAIIDKLFASPSNVWVIHYSLGHGKIESTARYLGIEVDDALEIAEKIDI